MSTVISSAVLVLFTCFYQPSKCAVARPIPLSGDDYILYDPFHRQLRNLSDEERLADDLFSHYDAIVGPNFRGSDPILINVSLSVASIQNMNELEQILHVVVWLQLVCCEKNLLNLFFSSFTSTLIFPSFRNGSMNDWFGIKVVIQI